MSSLISHIVNLCVRKNIRHAVVSPGSRSALLSVYFSRNAKIKTHIAIDERSAGYIALGLAQQSGNTVALVCTSGTAVLNYAPAAAEAFYINIPLLLITADRPPEWIGHQDGQAIHQQNIYGPHVKHCFQLPVDTSHPDARWSFRWQVSEAINLTRAQPQGPVHINVPIREPFYPELYQAPVSAEPINSIEEFHSEQRLSEQQWQVLIDEIERARKIVILVGQHPYSDNLRNALERLHSKVAFTLIGNILANLHGVTPLLTHIDIALTHVDKSQFEIMRPDLLISFGQSLLSKNLKQFFRRCPVQNHWHIQQVGPAADTLQSLTRIIRLAPCHFVEELTNRPVRNRGIPQHHQLWRHYESLSVECLDAFFSENPGFGEFEAVYRVIRNLPAGAGLHLGNSMAVRYASLIGMGSAKVRVYSNRGTSGIDGSMSTAVGHALSQPILQVLIIGDLSFFYDRNALWRNEIPANLRIVLLNNNGGGIFRLIDGPQNLPELDRLFLTEHGLSAESTAKDFGLCYRACRTGQALAGALSDYYHLDGQAKLLEVVTDKTINTQQFKQYKQRLHTMINQNPTTRMGCDDL